MMVRNLVLLRNSPARRGLARRRPASLRIVSGPAPALCGLLTCAALMLSSLEAQPLQLVPVANVGGGYLGVGVRDVNADRAKALKLPEEAGVEVTDLPDANSPASLAGLKVGDVVMQYNGQRVEGNEQFSRLVRETPPGREVKLQIYRNGNPQTITAKIGARPDGITFQGQLIPGGPLTATIPRTMTDVPLPLMSWRVGSLGAEVEALHPQLAEAFGVKEGVLVRAVTKGSAADRAGLKAGDVITRVGDARVATPADLSTHIQAARGQSAALAVTRERKEITVMVTLDSLGQARF